MKSPDRDAADEVAKPCTCHPDDNPPVPCAQKYALTDCLRSELATLRRRVDHEHQLFAQASGDYDRVSALLEDLFAMVQGECPSLLRDHHLFDKIKAALPPGRNEG